MGCHLKFIQHYEPMGGEVLTTWPGMDALVTSCHLDAFLLEPTVGTFQGPPPPRCTHYSGTLYGFYGGSSGFLFPTISTVFHREFCFSFRSQLKTFIGGINKLSEDV